MEVPCRLHQQSRKKLQIPHKNIFSSTSFTTCCCLHSANIKIRLHKEEKKYPFEKLLWESKRKNKHQQQKMKKQQQQKKMGRE